jgi:hypothetical protein
MQCGWAHCCQACPHDPALVSTSLPTILIKWMLATLSRWSFLHVTLSPGTVSFTNLVNRTPCPLICGWYQWMINWLQNSVRWGVFFLHFCLPGDLDWLHPSTKVYSCGVGLGLALVQATMLLPGLLRAQVMSPASISIFCGRPLFLSLIVIRCSLLNSSQILDLSVWTASCQALHWCNCFLSVIV